LANVKIDSNKINFKIAQPDSKVKPKILLIIESRALRAKAMGCISQIDCEFFDYESFDNTVASVSRRELNLILLDSDCGTLNAWEFLRMLYERKLKVPIILFIGEDNAKQKQEALRHGAFDFVKKPLEDLIFERTVRIALENGQEFVDKISPEVFERDSFEKIEMSLEKRVLKQIDKTCGEMKISRETFLQKAIQKVMAKEERTNNPSGFWSPLIITGVGWIDDQHYLLLMQIQEIYSLYSDGCDKSKIGDIFKFLKHYVDVHFTQEEQMFYVLDKAEREDHLEQHHHFKAKMLELNHELQIEKNDEVILELSLYCQKWFINHIRLIDQNLVVKMKEVLKSEPAA
jgi:hemerythrin-like metal-binding protein